MGLKENFDLFPIIESDRLILRQLKMEEAQLYMEMTSDKEIHKYMGNEGKGGYKTIEEVEQFINEMQSRFSPNKGAFIWAIDLRQNNQPIGYIECANFVRGSIADIAYWLSRAY
ncbi:GNAT family N-acetyltransferase [Paenibacillus sp. Marseille-Q9583]